MVIFGSGGLPTFGTQILYYTDPVFRERAAIPPSPSGNTAPQFGELVVVGQRYAAAEATAPRIEPPCVSMPIFGVR